MLKYNFTRLFKARFITKPVAFLMNSGFRRQAAFNLANHHTQALTPDKIEKLCIALRCTPNDLFEWDESTSQIVDVSHPIRTLKKQTLPNFTALTKNLTLEQLTKLAEAIPPSQ